MSEKASCKNRKEFDDSLTRTGFFFFVYCTIFSVQHKVLLGLTSAISFYILYNVIFLPGCCYLIFFLYQKIKKIIRVVCNLMLTPTRRAQKPPSQKFRSILLRLFFFFYIFLHLKIGFFLFSPPKLN